MAFQYPQRPSDETLVVVLPWLAQNLLTLAENKHGQGTRSIAAAGLRALWSLQKAMPWVHPEYGENPVGISVVSNKGALVPRGSSLWPPQPAPTEEQLKEFTDWLIPVFRNFCTDKSWCRTVDNLMRVVYSDFDIEPVDANGYNIHGMKDGASGDFDTVPWERVRSYYANR